MTTADLRRYGDRYVLVDVLCTGDGTETWRAHDDVVSRAAIVTLFTSGVARTVEWQTTFRRATDRLVALSHPGIAKTYDHGEDADGAWLAMAAAQGVSLRERLSTDPPLTAAQALDVIGQIAFALKAAHDGGVAHGRLDAGAPMVREDGIVCLVRFAVDGVGSPASDLRDLRTLAIASLEPALTTDADLPPDVRNFPAWMAGGPQQTPSAGEIGRTALSLAVTIGTGTQDPASRSVLAPPVQSTAPETRAETETSTAEAARKRVRNRLVALAAIVVLFGGTLLWIINRGAGPVETTVPNVVQLDLTTAQGQLTNDALKTDENVTDPNAIVTGQFPAAGARVRVGSTVTLTVSEGGTG